MDSQLFGVFRTNEKAPKSHSTADNRKEALWTNESFQYLTYGNALEMYLTTVIGSEYLGICYNLWQSFRTKVDTTLKKQTFIKLLRTPRNV